MLQEDKKDSPASAFQKVIPVMVPVSSGGLPPRSERQRRPPPLPPPPPPPPPVLLGSFGRPLNGPRRSLFSIPSSGASSAGSSNTSSDDPTTSIASSLEEQPRLLKNLVSQSLKKEHQQRTSSLSAASSDLTSASMSTSSSDDASYYFQQKANNSFRFDEESKDTEASSSSFSKNTVWKKEEEFWKRYLQEIDHEKRAFLQEWQKQLMEGESYEQEEYCCSIIPLSYLYRVWNSIQTVCSYIEIFISNLPLTIGAVGLSWVTQGVIWFKFMEENIDACTTVRFTSPECTYPEFPGCFDCDTTNPIYRLVVTFHYICHGVAALCCILFGLKCCLAWQVVADELSNPATSTPIGVVCITVICVAAGRGWIGEALVLSTSFLHFVLSVWFLYLAIFRYRLWPDPGWFPNTVGIAYAAVKTWLYYPIAGIIYMTICLAYLFSTFFLALYRVYHNPKISAPVCFISLSAPSIAMYAMTILAQPTASREQVLLQDAVEEERFESIHTRWYLPVMHGMLVLCLIGFASSLHALATRWKDFSKKEFSPAHMAFIFPLLSHTNAVQAYRAGVNSFSTTPPDTTAKNVLYGYWLTCLLIGTALNLIFTYKYVVRLPRWTRLIEDVDKPTQGEMKEQDVESFSLFSKASTQEDWPPPPPIPTNISFWTTSISPAVVQANERGALVRLRRGSKDFAAHGPFARIHSNVPAVGFNPPLSRQELVDERADLLAAVAQQPPRRRHRTASALPPLVALLRNDEDEDEEVNIAATHDMYGTFVNQSRQPSRHQRANTWSTELQ